MLFLKSVLTKMNFKLKTASAVILSISLVLFYQNCSKTQFGQVFDSSQTVAGLGELCNIDQIGANAISMSNTGFSIGVPPSQMTSVGMGDFVYIWLNNYAELEAADWFMSVNGGPESAMGESQQFSYPRNSAQGLTAGNYLIRINISKICENVRNEDGSPTGLSKAQLADSSTIEKNLYVQFSVTDPMATQCPTLDGLALGADDPKTAKSNVNFSIGLPATCRPQANYNFGDGSAILISGDATTVHAYDHSGLYSSSAQVQLLDYPARRRTLYKPVIILSECPKAETMFLSGPGLIYVDRAADFELQNFMNNCNNLNVSRVVFKKDGVVLSEDTSSPFKQEASWSSNQILAAPSINEIIAEVYLANSSTPVIVKKDVRVVGLGSGCTAEALASVFISGPTSALVNSTLKHSVHIPDCLKNSTFDVNSDINWSLLVPDSEAPEGTIRPQGVSALLNKQYTSHGIYKVIARVSDTKAGTITLSHNLNILGCPAGQAANLSGTVCVVQQICTPGSTSPTGCPTVANGTSLKTCNATGTEYSQCVSSCAANFVASGTQPNISCNAVVVQICAPGSTSPTDCPTIANGTSVKTCNAAGTAYGTCSSTCNSGYNASGTQPAIMCSLPQICAPNSTSTVGCPSIPNGTSTKTCNAAGTAYGTCSSTCSSGYTASGTQPQITCNITQICTPNSTSAVGCPTVTNGTSFKTCNNLGTAYGTCSSSCNANYTASGTQPAITCSPTQVCTPNSTSAVGCPTIANGTSLKTCNAAGTEYGQCSSSCAANFVASGTQPNITCNAVVPQICTPNSTSTVGCPDITNGMSQKTCNATGTAYGTCSSTCSANFVASGTQPNITCNAVVPQICTPNSTSTVGCPDITNGMSQKTCNATGTAYGTCSSSCSSGYNASGTQPNITCSLPQICTPNSQTNIGCPSIDNGISVKTCNNTGTAYGSCTSSCSSGYTPSGTQPGITCSVVQVCAPNSQTTSGCPTIPNGTSVKTCSSGGNGYGNCTSSCNAGYAPSGTQPGITCSLPQICSPNSTTSAGCPDIANGISLKTCNSAGTAYGSCSSTCNGGYNASGTQPSITCSLPQICLPNSTTSAGCPEIANGISLKTCNSTGTAFGSCSSSCNSGYNASGTQPAISCNLPVICSPNSTSSVGCPSIANGSSVKTCNASGTAYGSCSSSCSSGYNASGTQPNISCNLPVICSPNSTSSVGCPSIANGSSVKTCNASGTAYGSCSSSCNGGYNPSGTQPNISCNLPVICTPNSTSSVGCPSIANGSSVKTCNASGTAYGSCSSSCNGGYNPSGSQPNISCNLPIICSPNSQSTAGCPSISNGTSVKTCNSAGTAYGSCSSSCNGGYNSSGAQPNIACTLPNSCSSSIPSCVSAGTCSLTYNPSSPNQGWSMGAGSCGFSCNAGTTAHNNTCYACARAGGEFNPTGSPDVVRRTIWQAGCDFDDSWKPPTNLPAPRPQTLWVDQGVTASTQVRVYHMNVECEDGYLLHESGNGCFRKQYRWVDTGVCSAGCNQQGTISRRCEGFTDMGVFDANASANLCPATAPTTCQGTCVAEDCSPEEVLVGNRCEDNCGGEVVGKFYLRQVVTSGSGSRRAVFVTDATHQQSYCSDNQYSIPRDSPNRTVAYFTQQFGYCMYPGMPTWYDGGRWVGMNYFSSGGLSISVTGYYKVVRNPKASYPHGTTPISTWLSSMSGAHFVQASGESYNISGAYICNRQPYTGGGGSGGGSGGGGDYQQH